MQIKRFEAADMTEALRMVKREFGDDAVILAAKEIRSRGFFSALKKKSVEITAASDYAAEKIKGAKDFSGHLSQELNDASDNDRVSLSASLASKKVAARFEQVTGQPAALALKTGQQDAVWSDLKQQRPNPERTNAALAPSIRRGATEASTPGRTPVNERRPIREADRHVADPFYVHAQGRKVIALVGPPGAGKSTTVAKLARHCRLVERKRIGLISLDRFRIGANSMLESVARIMHLPLTVVHDAEQLQCALNDLVDVDVVLIDTPGMGRMNPALMNEVAALLQMADPDETHLVANATVREEVLAATVETFTPLGVNRLLFTHMDEYGVNTTILNLLTQSRLPSAFCGDGSDLCDHLQIMTGERLKKYGGGQKSTTGHVTVFPTSGDHVNMEPLLQQLDDNDTDRYVANRNSELFHRPDCKSVKRINAENITAFNSIEQAMKEGFKPCRVCCDSSMIRQLAAGTFRDRRVSAI